MWYNLLLDVLPYDGYKRPIPVVRPDPGTVVKQHVDTVSSSCQHACDSACSNCCADSAAAAQDFVVGTAPGGDDMTMLLGSIFVVFLALALCLYFLTTYRRSLGVRA